MTSVGLVLGGGGIAGFAYHTAVLAVLQRLTGWDPRTADLIVGTSAGSNVGATIRGNVPVGEALDRILTMPTNPRSMARLRELSGRETAGRAVASPRFGPSSLRLASLELTRGAFVRPSRVLAAMLPEGRIRTESIGDRAAELHTDGWPDMPLWLPAIRLSDGERIVFGRDRTDVGVGTATEASSAIPGFFRPVPIDGDRYVDGGLHSATNADLARDKPFDLVVVISPMSGTSTKAISSSVNAPIRLAARRALRREVRPMRDDGTPVLVIEPSGVEVRAMGSSLMDPTRVVSVVLQTSSHALVTLTQGDHDHELDLLHKAAAIPSPADVAYPA